LQGKQVYLARNFGFDCPLELCVGDLAGHVSNGFHRIDRAEIDVDVVAPGVGSHQEFSRKPRGEIVIFQRAFDFFRAACGFDGVVAPDRNFSKIATALIRHDKGSDHVAVGILFPIEQAKIDLIGKIVGNDCTPNFLRPREIDSRSHPDNRNRKGQKTFLTQLHGSPATQRRKNP
jgi:hypothetical protein